MNKVFSFGVDEDSSFFSDEFSSVEEFFEKVGSGRVWNGMGMVRRSLISLRSM